MNETASVSASPRWVWGHQRTTKRRLKKSTAGTFQNQIIPDCFYFDVLFLFFDTWHIGSTDGPVAGTAGLLKFCPEIKLDGRSMRTRMIDVYTGWLRTLSVVQWIPSGSDSHFCRKSVNVTEKFKNHETLWGQFQQSWIFVLVTFILILRDRFGCENSIDQSSTFQRKQRSNRAVHKLCIAQRAYVQK